MARTELVILLVLLVGSVSFTSVYAIELTGLRTIINTFDATPGAHWFKTGAAEPGSLFMNILGSTDSAAFAVQIAPGGNLGLHVGSDGNVGVGTGSPAAKLHVAGSIQNDGQRTIINGFDGAPGAHWFKTGAAEPGSLFMNILGSADAAAFAVQIAPGGNLGLHVGSDGNVGVGTGSPAQKLDVNGNIKLNGDILSDTDICIGTCP